MPSPAKKGAERPGLPGVGLALALSLSVASCVRSKIVEDPVGVTPGSVTPVLSKEVAFAFDSLDGRPVTSMAARGKIAVLALVTTWDLTSHAQVNYVNAMVAHDGDRVFYAVIAVQERSSRELVEAYARSLKVTCPVALVEPRDLEERGTFGQIRQVPTVVVLDRNGRVAWMRTGLAKSDEIRAAMSSM